MASEYVVLLMLFMFMIFEAYVAQHQSKLIVPGSSLFPTKEPTYWDSPSSRFKFGFYKQGNGFSVGIWLVTTKTTIVWTANRDDPPVPSNSMLTLTREGKLILKIDQNKDKIIASTLGTAAASMLDSGNFVLYNNRTEIIWSSFDLPTDTILQGQSLYTGCELFSRVSESNSSTGKYRLKMQYDGNLVLYPINTIDEYTEAYWASATNGKKQLHLYLNYTGQLLLLNDTMDPISTIRYGTYDPYMRRNFTAAPTVNSIDNNSVIYRATLGSDGIFSLFYHQLVTGLGQYNTSTALWSRPDDQCKVNTFCGLNSYCTKDDGQPACRCLPGTVYIDDKQQFNGCKRNFTEETCKRLKKGKSPYSITSIDKITWNDYPYVKEDMSKEDCEKSCLEDCNCDAALYDETGFCKKNKLPVKFSRKGDSIQRTAYFKMGFRPIRSDNGSNHDKMEPPAIVRVTSKKAIVLILFVTIGFLTCSCVFLAISGFFFFKYRVVKYKWLLATGRFGLTDELTLRSFTYSELKRATNGFKESLGRGSFGAVYKGTLCKGEKLVAVKRLEKVINDASEREFQAEMLVIGRTHHKNLVRLLGYCDEESKRLLVYEYMSNGSLADILFRSEMSPDWDERARIALDVARGILYLHDECEAPIIHCDIKPQNILMDDFWTAKISDFGLAKLLMPDQTRTFTLVRGTRGYMAPEWSKNTPISVKADVYSYGVVLLEIVCCRRNLDVNASKPEEIVLINWVYKCFINRDLNKLVRDEEVDKKRLENMVKVGLWCVQDEPALRPSMKSVVMMLEGISDVSIPPCPTSPSE